MTRTDRDHLRILSICYYVLAALNALVGCSAIIYLVIGIVFATEGFPQPNGNENGGPPFPAEMFGWVFIGVAVAMMIFYWSLAVGQFLAGSYLSQRKYRTFCLVMAGASCLSGLLGIALGVFTFIVLLRPSVREAFEPTPSEPPEYDRYHAE
ncbi:MAG: hypothetical protein L0241_10245 [Planctomycetia bacterium]|nr:hypothetical protein [Planctomycetia bacterium]